MDKGILKEAHFSDNLKTPFINAFSGVGDFLYKSTFGKYPPYVIFGILGFVVVLGLTWIWWNFYR
jgi:Na+/melibiose symporter-like transporter